MTPFPAARARACRFAVPLIAAAVVAGCGKTPPPPPLTHGLEHDPTEEEKLERLGEQVAWAERNNLLHRVQMFFDAMPASGWNEHKGRKR